MTSAGLPAQQIGHASVGPRVRPVDFGEFVRRHGGSGALVVQPRMGFSDPAQMRTGLAAVKQANATTVGTITLDSYTRVGSWRPSSPRSGKA